MTTDTTTTQIRDCLERWSRAVEARDVEATCDCYDTERGELLGTVATSRRAGRAAIRGYFERFLARDEVRVSWDEVHVQELGEAALAAGVYTFRLRDGDRSDEVRARFTFVFAGEGDGRRIVHHHSSRVPAEGV